MAGLNPEQGTDIFECFLRADWSITVQEVQKILEEFIIWG
jgi:hypothetical protein